jgi:UDP-N-acetylmuramoyl-tripeptide--D-alanyl-D-alanine ligase
MLWLAEDLLAATGGTMPVPFNATGVSIDTRTLRRGDLFIAVRGEHSDGHDHVAAALAAGAAGAMVHTTPPGLASGAPLLSVDDTLQALWALGRFARARFAGKLVAITGSVGKTTTKEMLRAILGRLGPTHAAEASYNNHWGVPLTLARLPPDAAYAVIEIGMNHAGEIAPLARLARPHVALITKVGAAHIGHLGSLAAIAAEKASILTGLEPGGVGVLPASLDTPLPADIDIIRFGHETSEAHLLTFDGTADGSTVTADICGRPVAFQLGAPGRHMADNAIAALAAGEKLGADIARGAAALGDFHAGAGRGARRPLLGGTATLLDESYNASPPAVRAALALLRLLPARRHIAVLGDMLELGDHAVAEHAGLAEDVAAAADLLFACGPNMRHLFDAVPTAQRGAHAADAGSLAPIVRSAVAPGDAVLVKGSLGSRMRLVVDALTANPGGVPA